MFSSAGMALGEEEDAWWGDINEMQQRQQQQRQKQQKQQQHS